MKCRIEQYSKYFNNINSLDVIHCVLLPNMTIIDDGEFSGKTIIRDDWILDDDSLNDEYTRAFHYSIVDVFSSDKKIENKHYDLINTIPSINGNRYMYRSKEPYVGYDYRLIKNSIK